MSLNDPNKLARRLSRVKHIVLVLSGKGGVGKSSVAVQLALSLLATSSSAAAASSSGNGAPASDMPVRIGLLDIDLTGPSIPRMLGLDGAAVHQSNDGWVPVYLPISHPAPPSGANGSANGESSRGSSGKYTGVRKDELKVMSIGFLLRDSRQAVVWRGPKKSAMIKQFLADVRWGDLDWLIIDTPPGTSDEHISLLENLLPAIQSQSNLSTGTTSADGQDQTTTTLHSILVTTPQAVSLSDVSKELSFTRRVGVEVLGLIENMSGYICPHCSVIHNIFGKGGGEEFCRIESEKAEKAPASEGAKKLRFLGRMPVDPEFTKVVDGPELVKVSDGGGGSEGKDGTALLERYLKTQSSKLMKEICDDLVNVIEGKVAP